MNDLLSRLRELRYEGDRARLFWFLMHHPDLLPYLDQLPIPDASTLVWTNNGLILIHERRHLRLGTAWSFPAIPHGPGFWSAQVLAPRGRMGWVVDYFNSNQAPSGTRAVMPGEDCVLSRSMNG